MEWLWELAQTALTVAAVLGLVSLKQHSDQLDKGLAEKQVQTDVQIGVIETNMGRLTLGRERLDNLVQRQGRKLQEHLNRDHWKEV